MSKNFLITIIIALFLASCNGGGSPVTPEQTGENQAPQDLTAQAEQAGSNQRVLWGLWEWVINTQDETLEVVPMRSSELHFNVAKVLDATPTKFNFNNFVFDKPNNTISLDVTLTHPFAGKPNLAGFDVKGILIGPGSVQNFNDPTIVMAGANDVHLLNPDGITRWWNPVEFPQINGDVHPMFKYNDGAFGIKNASGGYLYDATLNGYKLFADGLALNQDIDTFPLVNRAVFRPGQSNARHYDIWFPKNLQDKFIIKYNYAVDACWASVPGYYVGMEISTPDDFPAEANQPEPFRALDNGVLSTLFYVSDVKKGGTSTLNMRIYDWQGFLNAGDVADEISSVYIEAPSCLDGIIHGELVDAGSGAKAYAEYQFTIPGSALTNNGSNHKGLLTVISSNGNYQPNLTQYAGNAFLSYYQIFDFPAISPTAPPNTKPTAVAVPEDTEITIGVPFMFDGSGSYDTDGIITAYEWDFNNDGIYGDAFDSGTNQKPVLTFNQLGQVTIDLMVTDNDDDVDTLDQKLVLMVVPPNEKPVAIASTLTPDVPEGSSVEFDGTGSYDPDGIIVQYEWDFNGDGTWDVPDGGTPEKPLHTYNVSGVYPVNLRVTDDDGKTDILDTPLYINVYKDVTNDPPTACAELLSQDFWEGELISFDASCSSDPEDGPLTYLWDFNGDGVYGDPFDSGTSKQPLKTFAPGNQTVDLKVIDDVGKFDTLDVPFTFFVESKVVITLEEDQEYKSVDGYKYFVYESNVSINPVPVPYTQKHGPWDFTAIPFGGKEDFMNILPPTNPDVSGYIPGFFPTTTQYFTEYSFEALTKAGSIYLAERADFGNDILNIFGHIGHDTVADTWEVYSYGPVQGGPIAIQFPLTSSMSENWNIIYKNGNDPLLTIHYKEFGFGEGYVTIPFNGTYQDKALLTITLSEVIVGQTVGIQTLLYKWTGDDGRQLARLFCINNGANINFNPFTFVVTGEYRISVMKEVID